MKKRIITHIIFTMIVLILSSCSKTSISENSNFYFKDTFFSAELLFNTSNIDETLLIPLIFNNDFKDLQISKVHTENEENIVINVKSISKNTVEYKDLKYKGVYLQIYVENFKKDIRINGLTLEIEYSDKSKNEIFFPIEIFLNHENYHSISDFMTLKRMQIVNETFIKPSYYFVLSPNYEFEINDIYVGENDHLVSLSYGVSNSIDFNEVNDSNLTTIENDFDALNPFQANYNVYLNLNYSIVEGKYISQIHPIIFNLSFSSNERYWTKIMNTNFQVLNTNDIEAYIDSLLW